MNNRLHDWFYNIICTICYDRDYLYLLYSRHFGSLMTDIYENGKYMEKGTHSVMGIKSSLRADLQWQMHHRINFVGLNVVKLYCKLVNMDTGCEVEEFSGTFELSSGEEISVVAFD